MPDEMEEMEARLAAYIDGTLPPAQRVEIEAYLKSNPTHARLITELQSIKTAVATLPKEKAPVEVLDTLQAHLERQTLLENVEDAASPMRINHWPQWGAVAAMLLLATGLGVLIYQVLPSGRPAQNDLALLTSSAASRPGDAEPPPGDGVALNEAARPTAVPGLVAPTAPLANNADAYNNATSQPTLNSANGNARDEQQANVSQFGMAQTPVQQQQQASGVGTNRDAVVGSTPGGTDVTLRSAGRARLGTLADAAAPSATVNVLIVRTEDPALTANLVIGGLVQDGVAFERIAPASTQPADAWAGREVEAAVVLLQQNGDLPQQGTARELLLPARPVFVPAAAPATLTKLTRTVNVPGLGHRGSALYAFARSTPPATTQPVNETAESKLPTLVRLDRVADTAKAESTTQPAQGYVVGGAATRPTVEAAGDAKAVVASPADLYVLIVHDTPPAASQPAVAPTTTPATQPAIGEMP